VSRGQSVVRRAKLGASCGVTGTRERRRSLRRARISHPLVPSVGIIQGISPRYVFIASDKNNNAVTDYPGYL
jgi:hypothetical protein